MHNTQFKKEENKTLLYFLEKGRENWLRHISKLRYT